VLRQAKFPECRRPTSLALSGSGSASDDASVFSRSVEALRIARQAMPPGGTVLVVEEGKAETLTAPGDEVERFFGSASAIWYADVEIVPIEHSFWRFCRLTP
jgi:hypothetical protein